MSRFKTKIHSIVILFLILISYHSVSAQHDADSLTNIFVTFQLDDNLNIVNTSFNDSTLDYFHKAEQTYKGDILPADLGNIGSAYISEDFFKRPDFYQRDFLFNLPFSVYLKNSENILYYNTRRPYTSIMHTTSSKILDLQTADFTHTQNINPDWNIGLNYKFISSLGQYLSERKSLNSVDISTNYTKNKYSLYTTYVFNKFKLENSGGYNDSLGSDQEVPEPLLSNSGTILYNQELSITQKYSFGSYKNLSYQDTIIKVPEPKVSISHNILLSRKYRIYKDEGESEGSYFLYNYYQNTSSYDSIALQSLSDKIRFGSEEIFQEKYKFGFALIFNNDIYKFYNFKDYIYLQNTNLFIENQIKGELFNTGQGTLKGKISGNYYLSGYRKNDFRVHVNIKKELFKNTLNSVLSLKGDYSNMKPDYFEMNYYSNHYIWENNFIPTKRLVGKLKYDINKYSLNAEFNSALIKNYIYFDINATPAQFDSSITVQSASLEKTFRLKRMVFNSKVIWQYSSNDNIISLPELAAYQSAYFIMNYQNSLLVHLGFDVYYSTSYKAYNYNPATGMFYFINNTKKLAGNYPYATIFANLKVKRNVMLFFKVSNLTYGIISNDILPFYVTHYPIKGRMFKFGIQWTFKN